MPPLLHRFPLAILVTQHGCDSHDLDPLAHLTWSVDGQRTAYESLRRLTHETADADRLGALYVPDPADRHVVLPPDTGQALARPAFLSGGAGLIDSAADYHWFASMLLGSAGFGCSLPAHSST